MLRIYEDALSMVALVQPYIVRIKRHSRNLADQTERCSSAVPLNIAEGSHALGGNRTSAYRTALSEASETLACLHTARAAKYIDDVDAQVVDVLRKIMGTLVKNVR